jgi:hypothetical protein
VAWFRPIGEKRKMDKKNLTLYWLQSNYQIPHI